MCLRYCVLGFAAHSIISGIDCIRWWWLLYGWRLLRIHGLRYKFRGVFRLVLRLVARCLSILSYMFWEMWGLFLCTIFEWSDTFFYTVSIILFKIFLGACVRMIIHFDETYVTDIYVYELSAWLKQYFRNGIKYFYHPLRLNV